MFHPQTLRGGCLELNPMTNSPETIVKRYKELCRLQRDCILEWARLNPEKIVLFLDRLGADPRWQVVFQGVNYSLRLLHCRSYNKSAKSVELMEQQIKNRIYFLLEEERACLERIEKEVSVRGFRVLYLESVITEPVLVE